MKVKHASCTFFASFFFLSSYVHAYDFDPGKDDSSDPCQVVVCMYGKFTGTADNKCNDSQKTFFDIKKKHKGSIKWKDTLKARTNFLNQCKSADPASISSIISKYGKKLG